MDFLNQLERLYVTDGYACWHPAMRFRIRVVCARPYHALFAHNMLIRCVGLLAGPHFWPYICVAEGRSPAGAGRLLAGHKVLSSQAGPPPCPACYHAWPQQTGRVGLNSAGPLCCPAELPAHLAKRRTLHPPCRPSEEELAEFGRPDFTVFNAGAFPANRYTSYMTSSTSVDLSFARRELVRPRPSTAHAWQQLASLHDCAPSAW